MTVLLEHVAPATDLARMIEAEYLEMPGLNLTLPQAARLWQVDVRVCERAMYTLERSGFLQRVDERYMRVDGSPRRTASPRPRPA